MVMREEGSVTRRAIEAALDRAGFTPEVVMELGSREAVHEAVAAGLGAGVVIEAERDGDIRPDVDPAVTARLLFGMVSSIVEWYRPGRRQADDGLADAVCAVAFDGLRIRRPASAA